MQELILLRSTCIFYHLACSSAEHTPKPMEPLADNIFGGVLPSLVYKAFQYVFSKLLFETNGNFSCPPPHLWQDMNGPSGLLAQDKIQRRQKGRKSIENKLSFLIRG